MYALISIVLILVAPNALAGVFTPVAGDKSVEFLGNIFGPSIGTVVLGGPANPILGEIMEALNLIVVTIGMGIAGYVSVMSIVNTAQEGTVMGKKWSAVWIPMRSVMGLGLMIPAPGSGYSMIQATVMWVVIQGIGAADQLWNIVLDGMETGVTAIPIDDDKKLPVDHKGYSGLKQLSQDILKATSCIQAFEELANVHINDYGHNSTDSLIVKYGSNLGAYLESDVTPIKEIGSGESAIYKYKTEGKINFGYKFADNNDLDYYDWSTVCGQITIKSEVDFNEVYAQNTHINKDNETVTFTAKDNYSSDAEINYIDSSYPENKISQKSQEIFDKKMIAVNGMISLYSDLSQKFFSGSITPNRQVDGLYLITKPSNGLISTSEPNYEALGITNYLNISSGMIKDIKINLDYDTTKIINSAREDGWLRAGSMYFQLTKTIDTGTGDNLYKTVNDIPYFDGKKFELTSEFKSQLDLSKINESNSKKYIEYTEAYDNEQYVENYKYMAASLWNAERYHRLNIFALGTKLSGGASGQSIAEREKELLEKATDSPEEINEQQVSSFVRTLSKDMFSSFSSNNAGALKNIITELESSTHDPILGHALYGYKLMQAADALFFTFIGLGALLVMTFGMGCGVEVSAGFIVTSSFRFKFLCELLDFIMMIVGPMAAAISGFLYIQGAMLGLYMPLIPFMIFTVASLGWVITVIEAIIAAPLIALGMVTPSGDELGRVSHALVLLANIFLRPSLMIVGFLLAGKVYAAVTNIVNWGIADNYEMLYKSSGGTASSIFSPLIVTFIYVMFISSLANQSFSLIYAIPDKIMRWLGGPAESTNTQEADAAIKGGAKQGGGFVAGASSLGSKLGGSTAEKSMERRGEAKANKSKQSAGGGGESKPGKNSEPEV